MKALCTGWLTAALGLAGHLAGPSRACAHDAISTAAAHTDSHAGISAPASTLEGGRRIVDASAGGVLATDAIEPEVDLDASDDVDVNDLCEKQCGTVREIRLLPGAIFDNLAELPLLGAFVMPVTRGVTIEPGQGFPSVTFALKPTKFARGSGLVALGRF